MASGTTQKFRRQHEELVALSAEIVERCRGLPGAAAEVRLLMARFAGKLNVHASMENEALYPRLLNHEDPGVRSTTERLYLELDAVYGMFGAYLKQWPSADAIAADPPVFVRQTHEVFLTLGRRMKREDKILYPLVDAADAASGPGGG